MKVLEFFKKFYTKLGTYNTILILGAIVFFFIYSYLAFGNTQPRFTWPDEMANYFFSTQLAEHGSFSVYEPLNDIAAVVAPRSMNLVGSNVVPGSFLGLPILFGFLVVLTHQSLLLFFTPLLAAFIPLLFFHLLKDIFDEENAFISALALFILAPFLYYANLVLLPNIAFIFFLILGVLGLTRKELWKFLVGAASIGFALSIRSNEVFWVAAILIILAAFYYKKLEWKKVVLACIVFIIALIPVLYYNSQTFGSPFSFGYLEYSDGVSALPIESEGNIVFPFGFKPKTIYDKVMDYAVKPFWYVMIPALLGFLIVLNNHRKNKERLSFLIILGVISAYLFSYYGSWVFSDPLTNQLNFMGLSYIRYWLPVFILSIPLAVYFILFILRAIPSKAIQYGISGILIASFIGVSVYQVYGMGYDSIPEVKKTIQNYSKLHDTILETVKPHSIILTQRNDKVLFPDRKVISQWDWGDMEAVGKFLDARIPVYYITHRAPEHLKSINIILTKMEVMGGNDIDGLYIYIIVKK